MIDLNFDVTKLTQIDEIISRYKYLGIKTGLDNQKFFGKLPSGEEHYLHVIYGAERYKNPLCYEYLPRNVSDMLLKFFKIYGPCTFFNSITIYSFLDEVDRNADIDHALPIHIPELYRQPERIEIYEKSYVVGSISAYSRIANIYIDELSGKSFLFDHTIKSFNYFTDLIYFVLSSYDNYLTINGLSAINDEKFDRVFDDIFCETIL